MTARTRLATRPSRARVKAGTTAANHAGESLGEAEKAVAHLLESIKREANARLAGFSRLARVEGHEFTPNLGHVPDALANYERALQVLQPLAPRQADSAVWHGAVATALDAQVMLASNTARLMRRC